VTGAIPRELVPAHASAADILYLLDRDLKVVGTGGPWAEFARANGGAGLLDEAWHRDVLASCSGTERLRWQGIYAALRAGRVQGHEETFICPSPTERRTYRLRVTPLRDRAGDVIHILHHAVRADLRRAPRGEVAHAYRAAVLDRVVRPARFAAAQLHAPLEEVGGDLLWHHVRRDGTTEVVLADVMGHGRRAARVAVVIAGLLDAGADGDDGVAQKVARLNLHLCRQRRAGAAGARPVAFATGLYLRLRPNEAAVDVCSFAHAGPIFSDAGVVEVESGLPVGIASDVEPWPETTLRFAGLGRRLLLGSDGNTEQFDPHGEMFGAARLARAFRAASADPLAQVPELLRAQIEAFRATALVKDDRTLLAIERED
jgi:hypothetical protein